MLSQLKIDWTGLILAGLLGVISLVCLYSISNSVGATTDYFSKQLVWIFLGMLLYIGFHFVPTRVLFNYAYLMYALVLFLLIIVMLFGNEAKGARRWFLIGPLKIQPSEPAKVIVILTLARFISSRETNLKSFKYLSLAVVIVFIPFLLVNLQPDLGTSLAFVAIAIPVLLWAGMPGFYAFAVISAITMVIGALWGTFPYLMMFAVFILIIYFFRAHPYLKIGVMIIYIAAGYVAPQIWNDVLKPHQRARIKSLVQGGDTQGALYQVHQSKIAIGSGGWSGKGFMKGTQVQLGLVPEVHTDFIITVLGEEFGYSGVIVLIGLLGFLIIRLIYYAMQTKSVFGSIVLVSAGTMFLYQVFTNLGMAIGIMPVTGLPLPFISYGGSAMLTNMILFGVCSNVIMNRFETA